MLRFAWPPRLCCAFLIVLSTVAAAAAELPTADAVLQIQRANKQKLARLHLQLTQVYETTEVSCRKAQLLADEKEKVLRLVVEAKAKGENVPLKVNGKPVSEEEEKHLLDHLVGASAQKEIKRLRAHAKPYRSARLMEFFMDGENYQYRTPAKWDLTDAELTAWKFSDAPLSTATLVADYADTSIYSRLEKAKPAARRWAGSAHDTAYITEKHLCEMMSIDLPPMTDVAHPRWDDWHPFDGFFSQPAEKYRVVRTEEVDGAMLTVVDVEVPLAEGSSNVIVYRGWLDLARGAVPIKLFQRQGNAGAPADFFESNQPTGITTTHELRTLPGGAFYPAKTVAENFEYDPEGSKMPETQWVTLPDGKRESPLVVVSRHSWDCSLVEIPPPLDDSFFVLPFPEGQKLYDLDAEQLVGALPQKPLVQVGQQAPPLSIARWLDGKSRTLDDLRGQVVVLDFWGLWCGPCRGSVSKLKALQEQFAGKAVTFVSVHTAEKDPAALAARIEEFAKSTGWQYLAAIDAGQMIEDSVTTNAYGIQGFPTTVILGPDGKIIYADPNIDGPACDEDDPALMAEFEKKFNELWKGWFAAAGETWPLPAGLDEKEQTDIYHRVERRYLTLQIEAALKSAPK